MPDFNLIQLGLLVSPIISLILGLFIGLILTLTGAGGSVLAIPLLSICLHLSLNQAAPIALMAVLLASILGAIQGLRIGIVRYKTGLLIACAGIIFAPIGVLAAKHAPHQLLSFSFFVVLLIVAWNMWRQSNLQFNNMNSAKPDTACTLDPLTSRIDWNARCTKNLITTGTIAGFLSGLLGVGGGFVVVPSLTRVTNFNTQTVIATSLFAIALVSLVSILSYGLHADIQWQIAVPFIAGTIAGLFIFKNINSKVSAKVSQRSFAALAILAALLMLYKTFS